MNYLAGADQDLSDFQGVLASYKATIAPPSSFSDQSILIASVALIAIAAILITK